MDIRNVPEIVWQYACELEEIEGPLPEDWTWERLYDYETRRRGYTNGGIGKSISDYIQRLGVFGDPDDPLATYGDETEPYSLGGQTMPLKEIYISLGDNGGPWSFQDSEGNVWKCEDPQGQIPTFYE